MGDEEETGSVEESSVGTMTAKVMTTSTVYTFADGTSVTETVDANGMKVLTTESGQSITLGANVSQENMDTAPEGVSFTDADGKVFTDVTASEDVMELDINTNNSIHDDEFGLAHARGNQNGNQP